MKGAVSPSQRKAAVYVTVFQVPKGAAACSLWPRGQRPQARVILVLAALAIGARTNGAPWLAVEKHQPARIEALLDPNPPSARLHHVRPLAFARVQSFF